MPKEILEFSAWVNRVELTGRVSSEAQTIELPSDDPLVKFRIVVPRLKPVTKATVDTLDCVAFKSVAIRKINKLEIGDIVTVTGQLRRRFWKTGAGVASRVEIEVDSIKNSG